MRRFQAMMFLQYAALGSFAPVLSLYVREDLAFSGSETGLILATGSVSAIVSPLAGSILADRLLPAARLLCLCHLGAGLAMLCLAQVQTFPLFFSLFLLHQCCFAPTIPLSNAIAFAGLGTQGQAFGLLRVWGTIGWVAVAWAFGWAWLSSQGELRQALVLGGLLSLGLGLLALSLPPSPPRPGPRHLLPRQALRRFRRPTIRRLVAVIALGMMSFHCYYLAMGPFLVQSGIPEHLVMPLMSLGQLSEIPAMFLLRRLLARLDGSRVLRLGCAAGLAQFTIMALELPLPAIACGILGHGLLFTWLCTGAMIEIDRQCRAEERASVHLLIGMLSPGLSSLLAYNAGGLLLDALNGPTQTVAYGYYWLLPLTLLLLALALVPRLRRALPEQPLTAP